MYMKFNILGSASLAGWTLYLKTGAFLEKRCNLNSKCKHGESEWQFETIIYSTKQYGTKGTTSQKISNTDEVIWILTDREHFYLKTGAQYRRDQRINFYFYFVHNFFIIWPNLMKLHTGKQYWLAFVYDISNQTEPPQLHSYRALKIHLSENWCTASTQVAGFGRPRWSRWLDLFNLKLYF